MQTPAGFTPADVLRRVTAMGVLVNPAIVWSYLRTRYAERYPERAGALLPALLPVDEIDLEEWLDDFLDGVEAERSKLTRSMSNDSGGTDGR
jgi:hypothetical protein